MHGLNDDAPSVPFDQSIARGFAVSDLSEKTVSAYRNHYRVLWPDSEWNSLDNDQFLMAIGAAAPDKDILRPTFAGLLMFGAGYDICAEMPGYMLDYREYDDGPLEWTDRFTSLDGDWSGNLFEFFLESLRHLRRTFRHRMRIGPDLKRIDDSEMDKIVREALLNAVVNTDFSRSGGLVVERRPGIVSIRNPGTLMMPLERMLAGGTSYPRNPTVSKMFQLIGFGKGIGSGVPRMNALCAIDGITDPAFIEQKGPDTVTVRINVPRAVDVMYSEPLMSTIISSNSADSILMSENIVLNPACNCPKEGCPRHGNCMECVEFHKANSDKIPFCLRFMIEKS